MADQAQKAGDNVIKIQAGGKAARHGDSIAEARELALDVFRANFFDLFGVAKDMARSRAEEVTEKFLKKLQDEHEIGLKQAQEPDFQHALFSIQKEYALYGDRALGELLVDLLVDRTKHPSRSVLQIVLNEALAVAPRLAPDQIAALSLIFLFKYTINRGIIDHRTLWEYLDRYIAPFAPFIGLKAAGFQHLEYSGCGTMGLGSVDLAEVFRRSYGGLFSEGFDNAKREAKRLSLAKSHAIFMPCLNDATRLQVRAMTEEVIRTECTRLGIKGDDVLKLVALHNETLMVPDEVREHVSKERDYMRSLFEVWKGSKMNRFTLSSVGIAIGHANVKKNLGEFTDLSIWIN